MRRMIISSFACLLWACGPTPPSKPKEIGGPWQQTADGVMLAEYGDGFRQITRCWNIALGAVDCVWVGGSGDPSAGYAHFSAERWLSAAVPDAAGPPLHDRRRDRAYYTCAMSFDRGGLTGVSEELALGNSTRLMSQERWLHGRQPERPWSADELWAWANRTKIKLASPMLDCEHLGRLLENGSWEALQTNHWTGPNVSAADSLPSLA